MDLYVEDYIPPLDATYLKTLFGAPDTTEDEKTVARKLLKERLQYPVNNPQKYNLTIWKVQDWLDVFGDDVEPQNVINAISQISKIDPDALVMHGITKLVELQWVKNSAIFFSDKRKIETFLFMKNCYELKEPAYTMHEFMRKQFRTLKKIDDFSYGGKNRKGESREKIRKMSEEFKQVIDRFAKPSKNIYDYLPNNSFTDIETQHIDKILSNKEAEIERISHLNNEIISVVEEWQNWIAKLLKKLLNNDLTFVAKRAKEVFYCTLDVCE